jgi:all-trans-retinol dehydrogenase (NAD+)
MSVYKPNQGWLPREGFTADVVQNIVQKTILNPGLTLPLWLLTRYTHQGQGFALDHPTAVNRLKLALYFGIASYLNGVLNRGALNNWTSDKYDWDRELIVITGWSTSHQTIYIRFRKPDSH